MTASCWDVLAREHWQRHLPQRLAELEDPDAFFDAIEDEVSPSTLSLRGLGRRWAL
jgi:hypothetical protein